jgi:L-alanine-DL-glutamate epimerase-like enolase superfamily enzyme
MDASYDEESTMPERYVKSNIAYPDVFKPFGRLADGIAVEDGYVALPDNPGTGFEAKSSFYALLLTLTDDLAGGQTAT